MQTHNKEGSLPHCMYKFPRHPTADGVSLFREELEQAATACNTIPMLCAPYLYIISGATAPILVVHSSTTPLPSFAEPLML